MRSLLAALLLFSGALAFAAAGSATGAIQMLSTPSRGAIQLSHFPSGDIRAAVF